MRIERHPGAIGALVNETPDIAIEELRQALADKGVTVCYGTIRRFFRRHAVTRKNVWPSPFARGLR